MESLGGWKPPSPGGPVGVSKALPLVGMIVSGLVVVLFLADLAAGFPFQRKSIAADIGFVTSGVILAYLSWSILERSGRSPTRPSAPNR